MKRVCIYCGSNSGARPTYVEVARTLGVMLAQRGIGVVYGGGYGSLMGTVADAILAEGGEVIGVATAYFIDRARAYSGLTDLRVVASVHEQKTMMSELADAYIVLPGGFGTWGEFCDVMVWTQQNCHGKPCGLLNVDGYYDPLLAFFDHAVHEGFVYAKQRALIVVDHELEHLLAKLARLYATDSARRMQ